MLRVTKQLTLIASIGVLALASADTGDEHRMNKINYGSQNQQLQEQQNEDNVNRRELVNNHRGLKKNPWEEGYYDDITDDDVPTNAICGIASFSVYDSATKQGIDLNIGTKQYSAEYSQAKIMLEKYPNRKINIIANTDTTGCSDSKVSSIGCVRFKWGTFANSTQTKAPYTLYNKDRKTNAILTRSLPTVRGFQPLEAWAYESSLCTGPELNHLRVDVQVIPRKVQVISLPRIIATYDGVSNQLVQAGHRFEMGRETCNFIGTAFDMGYTYPPEGSLSMTPYQWKCWTVSQLNNNSTMKNMLNVNSTASTAPATITYRISASFTIKDEVTAMSNPDMPTSAELVSYVGRLFRDEEAIGPNAQYAYMSSEMQYVLPNNPFSHYTKITVS